VEAVGCCFMNLCCPCVPVIMNLCCPCVPAMTLSAWSKPLRDKHLGPCDHVRRHQVGGCYLCELLQYFWGVASSKRQTVTALNSKRRVGQICTRALKRAHTCSHTVCATISTNPPPSAPPTTATAAAPHFTARPMMCGASSVASGFLRASKCVILQLPNPAELMIDQVSLQTAQNAATTHSVSAAVPYSW
jgi:hypothetical protein